VYRTGIFIVSTATCCTQQLNGNMIIFFFGASTSHVIVVQWWNWLIHKWGKEDNLSKLGFNAWQISELEDLIHIASRERDYFAVKQILSKVDDKLSSKRFGSTSAYRNFTGLPLSGTHILIPRCLTYLKVNQPCCCYTYINTMPKGKKLLFTCVKCKLSCQHIPAIKGDLSLNSKID